MKGREKPKPGPWMEVGPVEVARLNQESRARVMVKLIKDGTLPNHATPANAVSGPQPCTVCGESGGKSAFQGFNAVLCHECFKVWEAQIKSKSGK